MNTTTIDQRIIDLKAQGKTDDEIRKATGVSRDYLRNMRRGGVLPALNRRPGWSRKQPQPRQDKMQREGIALPGSTPGERTPPRLDRFAYEVGGNLLVLRAPPVVVRAAERAYERVVGEGESC